MSKKLWGLLALLLAFMLVLAACTGDEKETSSTNEGTKTEDTTKSEGNEEGTEEDAEEPAAEDSDALFPLSVENEGDAISGGTLKVAMSKDEPFQGIFSYVLYEDAYDAEILAYASNSLFETDGDFLLTDEGIASIEVDQDNNKVLVKIREGVKWSDGEPLKIEDLIQPYLIIGHKDYTGVRYDVDFQNIVGAVEYHDGKADTISGLKKLDETTLEISFNKLSPAIFSGGDGIWTYAEPSHIVKDIPVAELVESDAVRKNPVTLGAFIIDKIVPGESVQLVANENYWKGKPKLDGVLIKVVPTSSISVALQQGEYDVAISFNASKMEEVKDFDNIDILGRQELYYSYLGFKLGKYDYDNSVVVTDVEGSKMGDVKLRQAMGYALDVEQVAEVFYNNLRERANSLIPPVFASFYDDSLEGYTYDPDKAAALLDEAGFKDVDGDGIREDKEGKPFEIKFATMSGDDVAEDITQFYIQNWKDVGLNVTLTTGRTIEFNSFYDKVQADDPEIDIFMAAWGTGTNPSPAGLYSKTAEYNFSRYSSDFLEETLTNIDSPKAFDADYRAEQFRAWQEYMAEQAPIIPTMYRYELVPVNKRVKNWNIDYANPTELQDIELVSDTAVKSTK
ncbi:oligopeptide ABC transporter substrate-binding protein [Psychrobacillus sp. NEAU-3TGS]|uniref:oligopeptide ABC transporter substrate-binding protein n=1 Tax=Psychrobacillus sp. NEAU-3TGS TaxID=2995412 RepID=UPI0024990FC3|nr:oligopeptide ABC transporter substrate-binding protein [Psychrobacillus sp. NEAU-3TGS]MDI2589671.1 oligopeptide ABC transporter substrate-binding protein [Psychrobacillus sp. NEAU-3TGS]